MQRKTKSVLYPVLKYASESINDEYWKTLFNDMSIGKCPKCIYISNNNILSTNKRKQFSFSIPKLEESELGTFDIFKFIDDLKISLSSNTSLLSNIDNDKRKEMLSQKTNEIKNIESWNAVKKKNIKEQLFINYVFKMKKEYGLDWNSTKYLYQLINNAFLMKTHTSVDVEYQDGEILEIEDIEYDDDLNIFINRREYDEDEIIENNDQYLFYHWDKYVNNINKN